MPRPKISAKVTTDTLARVRAERARRDLSSYISQAWPVIEPGDDYLSNWHIDAISEHLQAVSKRQIKRLIINVPPRTLKSVCVSVMWPTWTWIDNPHERFIFASYSSTLSLKHSLDRRSIIQSDWYQNNWGSMYSLMDDHNTMGEFENDKRGVMIASSVGGPPFGKGASTIVCDDILSPEEAMSDAERERANRFYERVLSTRFNNPSNGALVIVMQRLGELDLTGFVTRQGGSDWDMLVLPLEFDGHRSVSSLGWKDPRTEGDILHPARFTPSYVANLKRDTWTFATMYQQRPAPLGGGLFKESWWRYWKPEGVDLPPVMVKFPDGHMHGVEAVTRPKEFDETIQSWDCSFRDTATADFVAGTKWGRLGADKYLLEIVNERMGLPETIKAIEEMTLRAPYAAAKYVEAKANGDAVVQSLRHKISGMIPDEPSGTKVARAAAVTPQVEAGNVYLPHPALNTLVPDYVKQLSDFPNGANDDLVDSTSMALRKLGSSEYGKLLPEFSKAVHIQTHELKSWWSRWIAMYWGNEACALWFCQDDKKRVHVYRDLTMSGSSAEEFAAEVARKSAGDLAALQVITAWTLDDHMESKGGVRSVAQRFSDGFSQVLGHESSFIWSFNDTERSMIPDQAYASLSARRKKVSGAKILLQHSKGEYLAAWEHLRHLARTTPVARPAEVAYDRTFALQLLTLVDGPLKFKQYMDAVDGITRDILPKFYVADTCITVADALASAARSEKRPTEISDTPYKHVLNAMAFGLLAHREEAVKMPKQEFIQQRLDSVKPQDGNGLFMVSRKAEADYKKLHCSQGQPIAFKRRSVGGYRSK